MHRVPATPLIESLSNEIYVHTNTTDVRCSLEKAAKGSVRQQTTPRAAPTAVAL